MQNESWHCLDQITMDFPWKISSWQQYISLYNSNICLHVNGTFTHMQVTLHAVCTDALIYHDRCLLLHLSLMNVWMVPLVFGTENSKSIFPRNIYIYIYIYAFSRRFYPKRLTLHSSYSFTFYQLLLSLGIEPMILALLAPCSTIWATGKQVEMWTHLQHTFLFTILHVVFGERPKFFAILYCEMWFLICLTLLSWNLAQSDEPWSSFACEDWGAPFIPNHDTLTYYQFSCLLWTVSKPFKVDIL